MAQEGNILKKTDGFSLVENLFAMSIMMMLVGTILPIFQLVHKEEANLQEKLLVQSRLHDILVEDKEQLDDLPILYHEEINHKTIKLKIEEEKDWKKGCASWKDENNRTDKVCLYAVLDK